MQQNKSLSALTAWTLQSWSIVLSVASVLVFVTIFALIRGKQAAAFSGVGAGTIGDPFQVTTCTQLQEVDSDLTAYYLQMNDIDCNAISFTPIGLSGSGFEGHYNGDGYEIQNLSLVVNPTSTGLFANTTNAVITGVNLVNVQVVKSGSSMGTISTLIGTMDGGELHDSSATGTITQVFADYDTETVGGLVGIAEGDAYITSSYASVEISLLDGVYGGTGGFVGMTRGTAVIEDSYATGDISSGVDTYFTGGFVGWQVGSSEVYRSYATGDVHVGVGAASGYGDNYDNGGFVGGLGGYGSYIGTTRIEDSYSTGNVTADGEDNYDVGGFAGTVYDGATVLRSYSTGNVTNTGPWGNDIGGFTGLTRNRYGQANPVIQESFAIGNVTVTAQQDVSGVGGFIGEHRSGTISNSYTRASITVLSPNPQEDNYAWGIGGFVGEFRTSTITNSYAAGGLTVNTEPDYEWDIGGFAGYSQGTGTITSSYWDTELSGEANSAGGTGESTSAMKSEGTFSGWNFSGLWVISGSYNDGYPSFEYVAPTPTPTPSASPTATATPTATPTSTPTSTSTVSPTATSTATPTSSSSVTATATASVTSTVTGSVTSVTTTTPVSTIFVPTLPPVTGDEVTPTPPKQNEVDIQHCPVFDYFRVSSTVIEEGGTLTFSWKASYATRVVWSGYDAHLPVEGEKVITPPTSMTISLMADNGNCNSKIQRDIAVVKRAPWSNATAIGAGALAVEAAVVQLASVYAFATKGGAMAVQNSVHGNLFLALAGFLDRKKRRSYGVVYDSTTKKPVARAVVRLKTQNGGKIVDTVVTDANGVMRLSAHAGEYLLSVEHSLYSFPSNLVTQTVDGGYANVYLGGPFVVKNAADTVMLSVPIDPVVVSDAQAKRVKLVAIIDKVASYGSSSILVAGLLYSLYASIVYPHIYNYLAVTLYLLVLGAKVLLLLQGKKIGIVRMKNGTVAKGIELGLFDTEFKNLLYRTFTDKEGHYNFAVANGKYYLKVMDNRYSIVDAGQKVKAVYVDLKNNRDNLTLVTTKLILEENK